MAYTAAYDTPVSLFRGGANVRGDAAEGTELLPPRLWRSDILSLADDRDKTRHYYRQLLKICAHAEVPRRAESQDARRAVQP